MRKNLFISDQIWGSDAVAVEKVGVAISKSLHAHLRTAEKLPPYKVC